MSSGFSGGGGGGGPEFYSASSALIRPRSSPLTSDPPPQYLRPPQQFRGNFLDNNASAQIAQQPPPHPPLGLIGKRTLSELQNHAALNNLLLRSVRPRQASILSNAAAFEYPGPISLQRYGGAQFLQQQRPQPISNPNMETENKMMNRLHELEKQLLDDNDDDAGDVTDANSEWSETIQSLMNTKAPISSSPSSSSSSSSPSSSISVASPVSVSLKQSLIEAATAIYEGRSDLAGEILVRLSASSNPTKANTEQRLMNYVLSALKSRVNAAENPPPVTELFSREHAHSTQLLYDMSPCFKLGFLAANSAILEAALELPAARLLHIIDFDIGEGGQYQNILHALSNTRQAAKPSVVKITAVTDGAAADDRLRAVREKLIQVAANVGIGLRFNVVVSQRIDDLSRDSLFCESDEALVVNLAFKLYRMPDESVSVENPRDALLRRVKQLSPRVVTLIEQEWNANTAPFLMRVNEAFSYYGALLESIDSTVASPSPERARIEEELARKVVNSIACEGRDRVERCEVFGKWRARMGMAGFELRPMSPNVVESMKARLSSGNRVNPGFTVKEEGGGGVGLGWLGRTLTVASAWR